MTLWLTILGMAAVTFVIRLSFIDIFRQQALPPLLLRALQFVPVAVLVALIIPDLIFLQGRYSFALENGRILAALVAAGIAWKTQNALLTIIGGMAVLWLAQAFL